MNLKGRVWPLKSKWSEIDGIVEVIKTREDGVEWHTPVVRNGFNLNGCGVVTNPIRLKPTFSKSHPIREVEIRIANPSPDCWAVGFSISTRDYSGVSSGCCDHPVYPTGLMAVAATLEKRRAGYPDLKGVDFTPIVVEAVIRDLEYPEIDIV